MAARIISLLHATHRAGGRATEIRRTWLDRASQPSNIEHIFGLDEDDDISLLATSGLNRVVSPPQPGVTAVRNWNAAAAAATGDLLFVIADDLAPPVAWDEHLQRLVGPLVPTKTAFVIKVGDDPRESDVLLRHPVVSRSFYNGYGLFSPSFRGVFCDTDLTIRAFWRTFIIDGRSLRLEHRHPTLNADMKESESQKRMNQPEEYAFGRKALHNAWTRRHREAPCFVIHSGGTRTRCELLARRYRAESMARYAASRGRRIPRRLARLPRRLTQRRMERPTA